MPTTPSTTKLYTRAIVSTTPPLEGLLWFNPVNQVVYTQTSTGWGNPTSCVVSDTDPTLRTVWRRGLHDEKSTPQYVDKTRNPIAIGSPVGDWGVVNQWVQNPEHKNKKIVTLSQIVTHFTSILKAQPSLPGIQGGGVFTLNQQGYNYGVGGTIKEHNDSFDTLISAVNVNTVTPLGVLEYAVQEYQSSLITIQSLFTKGVSSLLTTFTPDSLINQSSYVTSRIIAAYENNDARAQIFGDSSAYDKETGAGVYNWIASSPMFGLSQKTKPHLNISDVGIELYHHDGHRSNVIYTVAELDRLSRLLCSHIDNRTNTSLGIVSSIAPPTTYGNFLLSLGALRPGVYWYQVSANTRTLYRFNMFVAAGITPQVTYNGASLPDGVKYYNTLSNTVFTIVSGQWVVTSTVGSGDISQIWTKVDLTQLLGKTLLEVEHRLYDVCVSTYNVFDYSTLTTTQGDLVTYNRLYEERFFAWTRSQDIKAPLVNVEYRAADPFTWNYSSSTITTHPTIRVTNQPIGSWQSLYTYWYGTPYPHLEPWKLQGYNDQPVWWDSYYLQSNNTRRWIYNHLTRVGMWENIRVGRVPVGQVLPDGITISSGAVGQATQYIYFSVNISDSTTNGIPSDGLFPPYFQLSGAPDISVRSLFTSYTTEISAPDSDYVFGDGGPVEWKWTVSAEHVYDIPMIAFKMQPARFLHRTLGPKFANVDGLQVEELFKQVYSHQDALFHGDVYNVDKTYLVKGLNQWYVNYNRSSGIDTSGEFRHQWVLWEPHQTYQVGGIIDTSTFEIRNKYIDVTAADYNVLLVNNGAFKELWMDAFEARLIDIPAPLIQYNNQSAWKIDLDNLAALSRPINYYGVKEYSNLPDPVQYTPIQILGVVNSDTLVLTGDVLDKFPPGTEFIVSDSSFGLNGTYEVVDSHFTGNQTFVQILANMITPPPGGFPGLPVAGSAPVFLVPPQIGNATPIHAGQTLSFATFDYTGTEIIFPTAQWRVNGIPIIPNVDTIVPVERFTPRYMFVDGPRSMSFALTTTNRDLRVDFTSRLQNDLCGLVWESTDTKDHKQLAYATNKDYRGTTWTFDLEVSATSPQIDDAQRGPSLTIQGRDANGNPVTYIVALFRYALVPASRHSQISINFDTVKAGFYADQPIYLGDVDKIFISVISNSYSSSTNPLPAPIEGWIKISNSAATGSSALINLHQVVITPHAIGMSTSYDDHYDQSPERIVNNLIALGYREWINHYCGMSIYPERTWTGTRLEVVDPINSLNLKTVSTPALAWHKNFAEKCKAVFIQPIYSVSYEMYSSHARYAWTQRDINDNFAETGYVPPSYLLSPGHIGAMAYLKDVFVQFATQMSLANIPVYMQVGEPWWWYNPGTLKPCIYDNATRIAFNTATGLFAPEFVTIYDTTTGGAYDQYKIFLRELLGNSVLAIKTTIKNAFPAALVTILPFFPTIIGKGIMETINFPIAQYSFPNLDIFQVESYDWIIAGNLANATADVQRALGLLGYPPNQVMYLGGFAPQDPISNRLNVWKNVFVNLRSNTSFNLRKQFIWAYTIVMRDSITFRPEDNLQLFFYGDSYVSTIDQTVHTKNELTFQTSSLMIGDTVDALVTLSNVYGQTTATTPTVVINL
jgi:hypothetical protein